MLLNVHKRNGKFVCAVKDLQEKTTVRELKQCFYDQCKYYPERQRFTTTSGEVLTDGTLESYGLTDNSIIYFKDLGVQISWRLVYVIEYLGPLLICPALFCFSNLFYGQRVRHSLTQQLALLMIVLHFLKREFETLFIHRFSHATMPIRRLPINCFHYWILCGTITGYYVFHPKHQALFTSPTPNLILVALMLLFEFFNLKTHIILRNLRPRGSKVRSIPTGWGFSMVSYANYFWEICAWTTFCLMTNTLMGYIYLIAASGQMADWALKKHRNYCKEFEDYPKHRKALIPLLL